MTEGLIKVSELSGLMNAVTTDTNQTITGNKTFSGTTSAVTQTAGTNNTTVATTAFVKTAIDNVDALPSQTSQSGKFLTTNGTTASWANVDALPSQTSQSGKYLTTNGTTSSWSNVEGVVNKNGNPSMVYNWVGTYADYVAGRQNGTILDNWLCYVTDDVGGGLTVYTKTEIDNLFNAIEPPGSIKIWAGTTIPSGYLLCDGSAISRTEYSALFSAIGTTYGAGDSSSTFNLPDFPSIVMSIQSTVPVKGNGVAISVTNGLISGVLGSNYNPGGVQCLGPSSQDKVSIGTTTTAVAIGSNANKAYGLTTDSSKSGIIADLSSVTSLFLGKMCIKY